MRLCAVLVTLIVTALVVRTAWLSDDAFITIRTIDNWHSGFGPRWNVDERVQVYTHPLWFLVGSLVWTLWSSPAVLHLVSITVTAGAVLLLAQLLSRDEPLRCAWVGALLALSRTFLSYSTSGLENPLTHLILVGFLVVLLRVAQESWAVPLLAILTGLAALNRLDAVLLFGPPLAWAVWRAPRRRAALAWVGAGLLPLVAWLLFATLYYGSPLPNTAYAKLATGIPPRLLAEQGLRYLRQLAVWDPAAAVALVLGLVVAVRGDGARRAVGIGVLLHLAYLVRAGGDFMAGRFLSAPLVAAVALLAGARLPAPTRLLRPAFLALPLLGLLSAAPGSYPAWLGGTTLPHSYAGVVDERAFYYGATGWLAPPIPPRLNYLVATGLKLRERGVKVKAESCIGLVGFWAGPEVHLVDPYGLGDPLLARLPVFDPTRWRPGHFERAIPDGYLKSLESGVNQVTDKRLARYLEAIILVTRGRLLSRERLRAIWQLHRGDLDPLLDEYVRSRKPRR